MKKTICELFAGVGGFRLAFENQSSEWETVWFSQWEPNKKNQWAHDCYVAHYGDIDENTGIDIALVNKADIPNHNLLVGGFPCQDYSVANSLSSAKGIEGKKGVLWWQIRDILIEKKPAFCLLENVDRLLKSPAAQRGRDFGIILACFAELGYSVEWRVINAAEYGAGQRRRRVFIFAYKNSTNYYTKTNKIDVLNIIRNTGFFAKTFPIKQDIVISSINLRYDNILDVSNTFKFQFENSGIMRDGIIYTAKTHPITESATILRQLLQANVDKKYYLGPDLEKWKYMKGAKKIDRKSKTGHQYTFSEGAIAFPDPIDCPARTMLTSEASLNRSTHVIEDPITKKLRLLTPVEAERIQGFDDNWTNTGMPERFRYFCMGNALVVPIVTRMAKTLFEIFDDE